jgi:hypothetical protein
LYRPLAIAPQSKHSLQAHARGQRHMDPVLPEEAVSSRGARGGSSSARRSDLPLCYVEIASPPSAVRNDRSTAEFATVLPLERGRTVAPIAAWTTYPRGASPPARSARRAGRRIYGTMGRAFRQMSRRLRTGRISLGRPKDSCPGHTQVGKWELGWLDPDEARRPARRVTELIEHATLGIRSLSPTGPILARTS